ncbi:putative CBL-interacting protein kinase 13 [Hordeum vulgare]|nr:putative CBL-interacting protein kinase 13 [Hordeum vulgare]
MSLARVWGMYEDENKLRLRKNVVNAEENFKVLKEKEKMEKDLRFFKEELQKKSISDKSATNIHQVVRAKAEKDSKLMKQELELMKQEREKTMKERDDVMQEMDKLMQERDELKKEKKKLDYMIGDPFKHKKDTKSKIRNVREILDEFE